MQLYKSVLLLLFILPIAFSQTINIQVPPPACENNGDLLFAITNLPQCTAEAFISTLTNGLIFSAGEFYNLSIGFLTASPDVHWFCGPYNNVMAIIESFYTVMLMGLGGYYIIKATDVEGRAKAKTWLKNILYMVVFLSFSFTIFELIIDLNTQISSSIYSQVSESIFDIEAELSSLIFSMIFAFSLCTGGYMTFTTLVIRYLLIPFLLFLFPLGIFLYFIPPMREWGAYLFKFIVLIIFMTTADSLLLLGTSWLFASPDPNLANGLVRSFGLIVGFGLIGVLNLIIFIVAALSIILRSLKALESAIAMLMRIAIILSFL